MLTRTLRFSDRLGRLLLKGCLVAATRILAWIGDLTTSRRRPAAPAASESRVPPAAQSQVDVLSAVIVTLLAAVALVIFWATASDANNSAFVSFFTTEATPPAPEGAAAAEAAPTQGPPDAPAASLFVFSMVHGSQQDIFALEAGQPTPLRLTDDPADDRDPAWSPDARRIAFSSRRDGNWELYVLDVETGQTQRLTYDLAYDGAPSWSPDGQWLAYEAAYEGNLDVYIIRADGGDGPYPVTRSSSPDYAPVWSPHLSGGQIAYVSLRESASDIFVISLEDPSEARAINVTSSPGVAEDSPAWAPDGSRLAYSAVENGTPLVYTVDLADRALSPAAVSQGTYPAWSPDGTQLASLATVRTEGTLLSVDQLSAWESSARRVALPAPASQLDWAGAVAPAALLEAAGAVYEPAPAHQEQLVADVPAGGDPPYRVVNLEPLGIIAEAPYLSDRVDGSFYALKEHVRQAAGWDFLSQLDSLFWEELSRPAEPGQEFRNWHKAGRAFDVAQSYYQTSPPQIELVPEQIGPDLYWRLYVRCAQQDGSCGEPLRQRPWDFQARFSGDVDAYENGGRPRPAVPPGYYIDFTRLASLYGWQRVPSASSWRSNWAAILFWQYEKRDGLDWWAAMRELYPEQTLLQVFGPAAQTEGR